MRSVPFLATVAVSLIVQTGLRSVAADEQVHEAKLVKAGDGKITLTMQGGTDKHTHEVDKDAKITLDDKEAKLDELKDGLRVKVIINEKSVVTKIEGYTASDGEYVLIVEGMT